jgi:DNA-binding response OmpR family regulator
MQERTDVSQQRRFRRSRLPLALIIDDDSSIRALAGTVLRRAGFDVDEAADGWVGTEAFRRRPADVVLCDIFMPTQDGLETIRYLTGEFIGVRIVAMLAEVEGSENYARAALTFGAIGTLAKPFTPDELLAALRDAVDDSASCLAANGPTEDTSTQTRQIPEGEDLCP